MARYHRPARALASVGLRDRAIAELKEAVRLQPDYVQARQALEKIQGQ